MENDRTAAASLRVPDQRFCGFLAGDATDPHSHFSPLRPTLPPPGAPNVLIVLLDEVGFGTASTYGEPCATSTADRLAAAGLRFIRSHTTALSSPTRAAILTGRNHRRVEIGGTTQRFLRGLTGLNVYSVFGTKKKSRAIADAVAITQSDSWHRHGSGRRAGTLRRRRKRTGPGCGRHSGRGRQPGSNWSHRSHSIDDLLRGRNGWHRHRSRIASLRPVARFRLQLQRGDRMGADRICR